MEDLGQILGVVLEREESDRLRLRLEASRQAGAALGYLIADEIEPLTTASLEDE